ncbi:MAG: response regulator [Alphaproteobacteria bacterium]|nr:response regulator [Alphaproteobacteria bacterium]
MAQTKRSVNARQTNSLPTQKKGKAAASNRAALEPVTNQTTKQATRILVAEDNPTNQKVLTCLLQPTGCHLDFVENGLDAIAAVARSEYDLVLMDMRMPKMDGVTATYRIRSLPEPAASVPIIALTADVVTGAKEKFEAAGMNGFVEKPINKELLFKTIEEHTGEPISHPDFA